MFPGQIAYIALILLVLVGCGELRPFPTWPPPPPKTSRLIQVAGWEDLEIGTLCLAVETTFALGPSVQDQVPAKLDGLVPVKEATQGFLEVLGVEVVAAGSDCDTSLTVQADFTPLRGSYTGGSCASGATLDLEVSLSAPGRPPLSWQEDRTKKPPQVVTGCPGPEDAPYNKLWREPLSDSLIDAFGSRAYCPALIQVWRRPISFKPNFDLDEATVAVPCLIELLRNPDPWIRDGAAGSLSRLGPQAKAAVPYLLQIYLDEEESRDMRSAAVGALRSITGVGTKVEERSDGRYAVSWSKKEWLEWWQEQEPGEWQ